MTELTKKGSLGQILTASRIISEVDILAALEEQARSGCRFGEALVRLGVATQEDVDWALSSQLDIPYIRLKRELVDPGAIALVPAAMARRFSCIPLFRAGDELNIAIADPLNRAAIQALELATGLRVSISVALLREIMEMVDECYGPAMNDSLGLESVLFSGRVLEAINADLSGSKLLDGLLITIIKNRLSSLSLHPSGSRVLIRGRRQGVSSEIGTLSGEHYPDFLQRLRLRASISPAADPVSEGCFSFDYRSRRALFRVALLQTPAGDYVTLTLLVPENFPERLADLELPEEQLGAFRHLARAKQGITFFASSSPAERSHFMGLMLEDGGTDGRNVLILGDSPVCPGNPYPRIPLPREGKERARLITAALDHDPDILVIEDVGEGLDFSAACRAAMRGKLVLAGLESRGSRDALRRLLFCQQQHFLLPLFVNGLVSLSGVLSLCPQCRAEYTPSREERAALRLEQEPACFFRSAGCDACGDSGFRERRFLMDALVFDDELMQLFRQAADVTSLEVFLSRRGRQGIRQQAARLLKEGELSPEEYVSSVLM
jgi:type II secretory ATPase GspE/PulE/Tfp pilus assembly ATPase PilB-like protein